jgi:hypothetical protein
MAVVEFSKSRPVALTARLCVWASRVKDTPGRKVGRVRDFPLKPHAVLIGIRRAGLGDGRQQGLGVRHGRPGKQGAGGSQLYDPTRIHDSHAIADMPNDAEVVCNKQVR